MKNQYVVRIDERLSDGFFYLSKPRWPEDPDDDGGSLTGLLAVAHRFNSYRDALDAVASLPGSMAQQAFALTIDEAMDKDPRT